MNDLKDYISEDAFNLHISFHLVGDPTYKQQKTSLDDLMEKLFSGRYELEHEDLPDQHDREVIYRLSKPLLNDEEELREFFTKLKELFEAMHRYLPSFTQSAEVNL